MQTRVLIGVFSFLTFAILYVLIRDYAQAIHSYSIPNVEPYQLEKVEDNATIKIPKELSWLNQLSAKGGVSYFYPASESRVKLLFEKNLKKDDTETFRVSVGIIDDYQFFCINQVLSANNIDYSYYKVGESIWLVVATDDEKYLRSVLEELKHYEIHYSLSKS